MACFHEFQIYESKELFPLFFLSNKNSSIEIKKCIYNYLYSQKKTLCCTFKRKQEIFREKNIVDSELGKTCHEQVTNWGLFNALKLCIKIILFFYFIRETDLGNFFEELKARQIAFKIFWPLAFIAISTNLSNGMFSWIPKFCSRSRSSWTMFFEGISDTLFCSRTCWQVLRLKLVFQELLHFGVVVNYLWESSTYVLHTTWNRSMKSNFFSGCKAIKNQSWQNQKIF